MKLSDADRARVIEAIRLAEVRTSGEIYCAITRASSGYRVFPLAYAAGLALLVPLPLIYFTAWPAIVIYCLQLATFLGVIYLLTREPIRYYIVPRQTQHDRVGRGELAGLPAVLIEEVDFAQGLSPAVEPDIEPRSP